MEPRIQYAKTSDGVNIAYCDVGQGPPLLASWALPSNLQLDWEVPAIRNSLKAAAQRYRFIRYDARGCGLSDRNVDEFSLDAMVRDIETVMDRLNIEKIAVVARLLHTPIAIAFASRHPDRVSRLALVAGFARGSDFWSEHREAMVQAAETDWEFALAGSVAANAGWFQPELAHEIIEYTKASIEARTFVSLNRHLKQWDVSDLLPAVSMPTLVLQEEHRFMPTDLARKLAAALPDSRLIVLPGGGRAIRGAPYVTALQAIDSFIQEGEERPAPPPPVPSELRSRRGRELPSGTATILFADIVDSTALTERLGDGAFRDKARELDGSLRAVIREHAGTPIEGKLLGDGVLAVFTSARQAIEAALGCGEQGSHAGLPLHLGLHAGDVIREENNVYGGAVNIAARIAGLSAAGEVLVSETVRSLARTSAGVRFEDRGEQALKGVGDRVRVWAVQEDE